MGAAAEKVTVLPGKKYTPEDILQIAWHRKWLILVPFVVASVGTPSSLNGSRSDTARRP